MSVTLKTIAAEVGVSAMAVSAVLNHTRSTRVSASTRERILQAAARQGYRTNLTARGLRSKRSRLIGVLVWKFSGNVTGPVLNGIDQALTEAGCGMLASAYNSLDALRSKIDIMLARDVDGVILPGESKLEYLTEFARLLKGRPAICIGAKIPGSDLPWISTNKISAAEQVFSHLYDLGHRDFLLLNDRPGFRDKFMDLAAAQDCRVTYLCNKKSFAQGEEAGAELAAGKYSARAVIAYNDENAAGVLRALHQANCRVPDDFSVVGYNNLPLAAMTSPGLTTVENPGFVSGQAAVQTLMQMFDKCSISETILIKPDFIIRNSTGEFRSK